MEAIFVPLGLFGGTFGVLYIYFKTRNIERLALIEKGISAKLFEKTTNYTLKIGMLAVGVGLGIFIASFIEQYSFFDKEIYPVMVFILGGIALILNYFIERNKKD